MDDGPLTPLAQARADLGLSQRKAISKLREMADACNIAFYYADDSMYRLLRYWEKPNEEGGRPVPAEYERLFCLTYNRSPAELGFTQLPQELQVSSSALTERLHFSVVDDELVDLVENHTQNFRMLDRRHGAGKLFTQTKAHVEYLDDLLNYAVPGPRRDSLAAALAEAAALSGWQALDMCDVRSAWDLHEIAKKGARDAENTTVLAHVTAQQGYVLLDSGHTDEALVLVQRARSVNPRSVHPRMTSWLAAAEGEMRAAAGDDTGARHALEEAERLLPDGNTDTDPELPFCVLNSAHLARWRGHCLARLGADEAISDITIALSELEGGQFRRAEAGMRVDLALALSSRGEKTDANEQAERAKELAGDTHSARQRARIDKLQQL